MRIQRIVSKYLVKHCNALTIGAIGWMSYEIYKIHNMINSLLATNVLNADHPRPNYIHIDDIKLQEHYADVFGDGIEDAASNKDEIESKLLSFETWLESVEFTEARRLVSMCRTGSPSDRKRAVKMLSTYMSLKDWHYHQLALQCDALTAIALARSNSDKRWFLEPPYHHHKVNSRRLVYDLRTLLMALGPHPCMKRVLDKAFPDFREVGDTYDHGHIWNLGISLLNYEQDAIKLCVEAILHLSADCKRADQLVKLGALSILIDIYKYNKGNLENNISLAEIISNMALGTENTYAIFRTGWIGILYKWSLESDIRLRGQSLRALANLDKEDSVQAQYLSRVYLLHPSNRTRTKPTIDVVFVHGLLGGVFYTWRQKGKSYGTLGIVPKFSQISECDDLGTSNKKGLQRYAENLGKSDVSCNPEDAIQRNEHEKTYTHCWPMDWLPKDCSNIRVLGVNFETALSQWTGLSCQCYGPSGSSIDELARDLLFRLACAGVGQDSRRIVWVAHSLGGILVKSMLVQANENNTDVINQICANTEAVIFLATPHRGSTLATFAPPIAAVLWPSLEVQELKHHASNLMLLHERFLELLNKRPFEIVSLCEGQATSLPVFKVPVIFVKPSSANPGVGDFYISSSSHLGICKPTSRNSFFYQRLLRILHDLQQMGHERSKYPTTVK